MTTIPGGTDNPARLLLRVTAQSRAATLKGKAMSKNNRQRKVVAQKARVQAREAVMVQEDKFHSASDYAANKRACIATWEAHKSAQVMVENGIIHTHW
jgi:hypothetical protein